jgi:4'-phosphopantetheinyl transferase
MPSDSSPVDRHAVHVWHAHIDDLRTDDGASLAGALNALEPLERARYARFRRDSDRHMFLLGRVMARAIVGDALGVAAHAWRWREGLRGRPEIDLPDCPLSFNLAHSAGVVVCGLSWTGRVGVDVEDRQRAPVERDLVARCCAEDEAADVAAHGDAWRDRFLQYWTLKEAYLKAVGLGISVHLPDVRFSPAANLAPAFQGSMAGADAGWTFTLRTLDAGHYVAVAAEAVARPLIHLRPFPAAWLP